MGKEKKMPKIALGAWLGEWMEHLAIHIPWKV